MASTNKKIKHVTTHEGGRAKHINPELQLRRSVMACMLFENSFYENGEAIADRIASLVAEVPADIVAEIAIEAKEKMKLRHVPLYLAVLLAEKKGLKRSLVSRLVTRADDMTELLSLYWRNGKKPLSKSLQRGLGDAFAKFNEYGLAKYKQNSKAIKLRDVLRLSHPKPASEEQSALWKSLIEGTIKPADTWEVHYSAATSPAGKLKVWRDLLAKDNLGGLAILRNLRNMQEVLMPREEIRQAINGIKSAKLLPINFIAAARHATAYEDVIQKKFFECFNNSEKLPGTTLLLVDVSGSMADALSGKSDLRRVDAACGLAMIAREKCEDVEIFTFQNTIKTIAPRNGFALRDEILKDFGGGTELGSALKHLYANHKDADRLIIITDEQTSDRVQDPIYEKSYVINVGTYQNGIGYGSKWTHIDGWSDAVINYITASEQR